MKTIFILIFFLTVVHPGSADFESCGCDLVLDVQNGLADGNDYEYKAGDTLCIEGGKSYSFLRIRNFHGEPGNRLTIKNCGGQVKVGPRGNGWGVFLNDNSHFRFTGTGSPEFQYGISIDNVSSTGINIRGKIHDYEIDHIESSNNTLGFHVINKLFCSEPEFWKENFTMKNVSIHDNFVHDVDGEGFYIGYSGTGITCDGKLIEPSKIENIEFFNNRTNNTGWDGFQIGNAIGEVKVYSNVVSNYGLKNKPTQDDGIVVNNNATGDWYNNIIIDGKGGGISVLGNGNVRIFNNLIVRPREFGIFVGNRADPDKNFKIYHNTIISPGDAAILMNSKNTSGNAIFNNLLVANQSEFISADGVDVSISGNMSETNISALEFSSPETDDYRLTKTSPAIDAGEETVGMTPDFDLLNAPRPVGSGFDVGAYEFEGTSYVLMNPAENPNPDYIQNTSKDFGRIYFHTWDSGSFLINGVDRSFAERNVK